MELEKIIQERRSYRSLEKTEVSDDILAKMIGAASLAPSCYNNQPWRFVFARKEETLKKLHGALSKGNEWAQNAGMITAVFTKRDLDCVVAGKEYSLFDTGMASAFLMLSAWDNGFVAHPIAGYDEAKVKEILAIPAEMTVIALFVVGKRAASMSPLLTEKQAAGEAQRPPRLAAEKFAWYK